MAGRFVGLNSRINDQIHDLAFQRLCHFNQTSNGYVLFAPFDQSDIIPMDIGMFRQFFLRQFTGFTTMPDGVTQFPSVNGPWYA